MLISIPEPAPVTYEDKLPILMIPQRPEPDSVTSRKAGVLNSGPQPGQSISGCCRETPRAAAIPSRRPASSSRVMSSRPKVSALHTGMHTSEDHQPALAHGAPLTADGWTGRGRVRQLPPAWGGGGAGEEVSAYERGRSGSALSGACVLQLGRTRQSGLDLSNATF